MYFCSVGSLRTLMERALCLCTCSGCFCFLSSSLRMDNNKLGSTRDEAMHTVAHRTTHSNKPQTQTTGARARHKGMLRQTSHSDTHRPR